MERREHGESLTLTSMTVHAGAPTAQEPFPVADSPVLTTTFERQGDGGYPSGYSYTRTGTPNRQRLESALAELEGGEAAIAFSSGTAAMMAVLMALGCGDEVLVATDLYYGARAMLRHIFPRWGLVVRHVAMTDLAAVRAALSPKTRLLWLETPSNPMLRLTDIAAISEVAHQHGAAVMVDNTLATPLLQRPLNFGADMVMHSLTKYIGGHSDVLGGGVVVKERGSWLERLRLLQMHGGSVLSPFDSWLCLRGLRTLAPRLSTQCATARALVEFLQDHPRVEAVYYPGFGHQSEIARRQMPGGGGGLLAFQVKGDAAAAMAVTANCRFITRATSLGGVETLIEHRASMEGPDTATPDNLIRLAVGLEDPRDLKADLAQALARV